MRWCRRAFPRGERLSLSVVDTLGIDIGGTKIAVARVSGEGQVLTSVSAPTPAGDPAALLQVVADLVANLTAPDVAPTVGVACAAFMNETRDRVYLAPNIAWKDYPLLAELEAVLERPVVIENDANAAGVAEFEHGAGRGARSMVMLTIGTGVGGAVISEGILLTGGFGVGAELGHVIVEPNGRLCGCGSQGCLEQYASGTALVREAAQLLGRPVEPDELRELLVSGDPQAREALESVARHIGRALVTLVAVLDPDVIVLGGGVSDAGAALITPLHEEFARYYGPYSERPVPRIVTASMGNTAGVVGAATLARLTQGEAS